MSNSIRNIILICAMGAVAIMCVGLFLYDYIPSGLTVSKANEYETASTTTEVLSDVKTAQELLTAQTSSTSSTSGTTPVVKTNIVLKEYDVSKADLALYQASGDYVKGRSDPFAEVTVDNTTGTGTTSGGTVTNTVVSDGTFYNSTKVK